jgi:hypothetical protein
MARGLPLALLLVAAGATAQQVSLDLPQGPHYVGDAIEIRVVAEGFEEEPAPVAEAPPPSQGSLALLGVSPDVSSSIAIINGRVTQTKRVRFVYRYRYFATSAGSVTLGPFRVSQGAVARNTESVQLKLRQPAESNRLGVRLRLPEETVYVGERVPVSLEFWLAQDLQKNLLGYRLRVPLFDLSESFHLLDAPDAAGDTDVEIETAAGTLRKKGTLQRQRRGGRDALVVSLPLTLVPLAAGTHALPPVGLLAEEGTQWRRDFFGGRRATRARKWRALDRERTLTVEALPLEQAPPSFAGAVGSGFNLEVSADRSVVQVGEPITLSLVLRGEGNLENAAFPPLDAEGLLPAAAFRVPEDELAGALEGGEKRFSAVVRVLDERVREIPALAYSWFDPATGGFETARSRPIALSVGRAEVIGAEDVIAEAPADEGELLREPGGEMAREGTTPGRDLAFTGADLAIERDPELLLRDARSGWGSALLPGSLYAGAVLLVGLALLDRRRRDVDPEVARRRKGVAEELRRIRGARGLPAGEAAAELARALRSMRALVPDAGSPELDSFLGECDARSYAPASGREVAQRGEPLHERALELGSRIAERVQ